VPRVISFIVLLVIVLLAAAVFFRVMAHFFVPLFLAAVLVVIFEPLHRSILNRLPGKRRTAAFLTTVAIILVVVLPLVLLGRNAYIEFRTLLNQPVITQETAGEPREVVKKQPDKVDPTHNLTRYIAREIVIPLAKRAKVNPDDATIEQAVDWASGFATRVVVTGVQSVIGILLGLFILVIALYFFLADGPAMIEAVMAVSPLDRRHEQELLKRFAEVSRAVVVATLVSALSLGVLGGVGYHFALPRQAPIFLLMALTAICALVPIFGPLAVYPFVCGWIYLRGEPWTAVILATYCTFNVFVIDNILKPAILHGQSKLHPLLALLSILGGIEAFGPVGILVGPMLVSFLQALLNMLRKELDEFGDVGSKPLAESVVEALHIAGVGGAATSAGASAGESNDSTHGGPEKPPAKTASARRSRRRR
jgi:predicted PurR-regulated permease PerM